MLPSPANVAIAFTNLPVASMPSETVAGVPRKSPYGASVLCVISPPNNTAFAATYSLSTVITYEASVDARTSTAIGVGFADPGGTVKIVDVNVDAVPL